MQDSVSQAEAPTVVLERVTEYIGQHRRPENAEPCGDIFYRRLARETLRFLGGHVHSRSAS